MVRILKSLSPRPTLVRWIDAETQNAVRVPGITYWFQKNIEKNDVLGTHEFDDGLRDAILRHGLRVPRRTDGWLVFDTPRHGFSAILVEAKSGAQGPDAAVYQLKVYRAALRHQTSGKLLLWGVTETPLPRQASDASLPCIPSTRADYWVFSSADEIIGVLASLGLSDVRNEATDGSAA